MESRVQLKYLMTPLLLYSMLSFCDPNRPGAVRKRPGATEEEEVVSQISSLHRKDDKQRLAIRLCRSTLIGASGSRSPILVG